MAGYSPQSPVQRGGDTEFSLSRLLDSTVACAFLALCCGALLPLTLAPFDWWPLGILSIGGWLWLLNHRPGRAALLGFAYGVGKYSVGVSWVYVSMRLYGGASLPLGVFLVALFVAGLSVFPLLQGWAYVRARPPNSRRGNLLDAALFILVWGLFEWLLVWVLTGFPWLFVGHAHVDTALGNLMPVGGVLLASLGMVATSAFLLAALRIVCARFKQGEGRRGGHALFIALGLAALPWAAGYALRSVEWVHPGSAHQVALVQGNVDQAVKWRAESRQSIIDRYLDLTEPHWGADLIVWPEAAVTLFEHQATEVLRKLGDRGEREGSAVVLGIPTAERIPDGDWRVYNSAMATGEGGGRYHKRRLVPFGDYVPFAAWLRGVVDFFDLPMSSFTPGSRQQGLLDVGFGQASIGICYEVVYAELMRQSEADLLLTISNDTWFGESIGPLQHMQIARARAMENGRWLLRGTNNGVTAIVDHRGRVTGALPQFERGVLTGEFRLMRGTTPYGRFGDTWLIALIFVGLLMGFLYREQAARSAAS